jgi:hypothetical protein
LIINLKTAKVPASPCCCPKAEVNATLLDDRTGSNGRVRSLFREQSLAALSARNAYGRFLVFTVRTRLVGKGSNGST